jgi:RHS repeat-associated protein
MTGLDYFGARYFSGAMGRFTSPDEPLIGQDEQNPQSWNLYSYVQNNPLVNVDPWGHDCVYTYGATQSDTSITVGIERGNCSSSAGTYVAGTIDTKSLALNNGAISYNYSPYSGADLGAGTIGLPVNEFPGIQGQANYFGAQRIVGEAGPVVNTLAGLTVGFVGGAMATGTLAGTAATSGIVSQTSGYLSKSAARAVVSRLATSGAQAAAAAKAVQKATSSSSVEVLKQGTDLVVRIFRAGADNGHQEIEYIIDQVGNKQVVQKAFSNAGSLIHYDPK